MARNTLIFFIWPNWKKKCFFLQDEIEKVQESQEKLTKMLNKMRYNNKEMKGRINNLEGMMKALLEAQNIRWQDEDDQEESEEISPFGNY